MREGVYASQLPQQIAVAVVEFQDHFLMGQRTPGSDLAGWWEFPGGKVHDGEDPAVAAVRECREETGIDVSVECLLLAKEHAYPHKRVSLQFYRCALSVWPIDNPPPLPNPPFVWIPRTELRNLDVLAGSQVVVDRIVNSND
ncbi:MAG: NUDIX domain-containing protein [Pirellulaceae bacterium]|nr:NUDIX domain-containing protein [Planctomycetales bacterium]